MSSSDILSIVSLVIAIIAFVVAVAQALQQFAASAEGYRRCKEQIMGPWGRATQRVFTLDEFRFQVMFDAPIIFVASPENTRGPVQKKGGPVQNVDGSLASYEATRTRLPSKQESDAQASADSSTTSRFQRVSTVDDELTTWLLLLETLQKVEAEGRKWDHEKSMTTLRGKQCPEIRSTLVVQLQHRRRCWDQMPDQIQKPFATTTISHIAEMAALLGMVWINFDLDSGNLRAEGNGVAFTSTSIQGLGIAMQFAITGRSTFEDKRLIPCPAMKELLFGSVPTMIEGLTLTFGCQTESSKDQERERNVTRRALKNLKCDPNAIEMYMSGRHEHMYSINFELIAMIGQVFRLRLSNFKRIPNPTPDPWNPSLSACRMMREFLNNLNLLNSQSVQTRWIQNTWTEQMHPVWKEIDSEIDIDMREIIHDVLDSCDRYFKLQGDTAHLLGVGVHLSTVIEILADKDSFLSSRECDTEGEVMEYYFRVVRDKVVSFDITKELEAGSPIEKKVNAWTQGSESERQDIWVTLIFRMCCWWLLHDFDETSTMILPTRLKGSRLPVYIL